MKILTQEEFEALGQGPHDARVVGVPPCPVMNWNPVYGDHNWPIMYAYGWEWHNDEEGMRYGIDDFPIWHKLPPDPVETPT
jgi:hypothetical protein